MRCTIAKPIVELAEPPGPTVTTAEIVDADQALSEVPDECVVRAIAQIAADIDEAISHLAQGDPSAIDEPPKFPDAPRRTFVLRRGQVAGVDAVPVRLEDELVHGSFERSRVAGDRSRKIEPRVVSSVFLQLLPEHIPCQQKS
jgi:hypothetical protein